MPPSKPPNNAISPQKRRHLLLTGHPTSPLIQKRAAVLFNSSDPQATHSPIPSPPKPSVTLLYTMDNNSSTGRPPDKPTVPFPTPKNPSLMDRLTQITHENRLKQQEEISKDKGTEPAYSRHLSKYETWWEANQMTLMLNDETSHTSNTSPQPIEPAHPITATKAALWLKHESEREKTSPDGTSQPQTRLGPSSIRQRVSALEYYRSRLQHQENYRQCPESHITLRDDIRIQILEQVCDAKEAERLCQMHINKADGIQSATYTETQLIEGSIHFLKNPGSDTPAKIHIALRNRAMLLLSCCMAFRGDNEHNILWSDLFLRDIPLVDIGLNHTIPALVIFSNQGKENTTGRTDEHGAFRHRIPELCCIGALAFYFFSLFHIEKAPIPDFSPDYNDPKGGSIGTRDWYSIYLFPGHKDNHSAMTYANHQKLINKMKQETGIHIKKSTHGGRFFTVEQAGKWGASVESRMALGGWMNSSAGSFKPCYDRALPTDAMLAAAGFNAQKQTSHFLARGALDPPKSLTASIFPWIGNARLALESRIKIHGRNGQDNALKSFLSVLDFSRYVALQDAAVLFISYPDSLLFSHAPFNSPEFRNFARTAASIISHAEEEARHQLDNLPDAIADTFRGLLTSNAMLQAEMHAADKQSKQEIHQHLHTMAELQKAQLLKGASGKKRKAIDAALDDLSNFSRAMPAPLPSASSDIAHNHQPHAPPVSTSVDAISHSTTPLAPPPQPHIFVSPSGGVYTSTVFPFSTEHDIRAQQESAIVALENIFTFEKLVKHRFQWEEKEKSWLPEFDGFWKPSDINSKATIDDFWAENVFGMEGKFSIQELEAKWGARWKRNRPTLKTEGSRRNKVVNIIQKLSSNTNWNSALAIRFLHEKYPAETKSGRNFSDFLNAKTIESILLASKSYP